MGQLSVLGKKSEATLAIASVVVVASVANRAAKVLLEPLYLGRCRDRGAIHQAHASASLSGGSLVPERNR
jgi:hypothetical protein